MPTVIIVVPIMSLLRSMVTSNPSWWTGRMKASPSWVIPLSARTSRISGAIASASQTTRSDMCPALLLAGSTEKLTMYGGTEGCSLILFGWPDQWISFLSTAKVTW